MILFYLIAFLATIGGGIVLIWAFLALKNHRKFSQFPGPPLDSFFLGHLPAINEYMKNGKYVSRYFYDHHLIYGFTYRLGSRRFCREISPLCILGLPMRVLCLSFKFLLSTDCFSSLNL